MFNISKFKKPIFYISLLINLVLLVVLTLSILSFVNGKTNTLKNGVKVKAQILAVRKESHKYYDRNVIHPRTNIVFYIDINYKYKDHSYVKTLPLKNFETYQKYGTRQTTTATIDPKDPNKVYVDGSLAPDSLYFLGGVTFAYTFIMLIVVFSIFIKKRQPKAKI